MTVAMGRSSTPLTAAGSIAESGGFSAQKLWTGKIWPSDPGRTEARLIFTWATSATIRCDAKRMIVYRVVEPLISSTDSSSSQQNPRSTQQADVIRFRYPDGKHNSETLLVHPSTGDLYIVTKVSGEAAGVYKAKAPLSKSSVTTLKLVGEVRFPNALVGVITGGDISPDGRRIILCDYLEAFELVLSDKPGIAV